MVIIQSVQSINTGLKNVSMLVALSFTKLHVKCVLQMERFLQSNLLHKTLKFPFVIYQNEFPVSSVQKF